MMVVQIGFNTGSRMVGVLVSKTTVASAEFFGLPIQLNARWKESHALTIKKSIQMGLVFTHTHTHTYTHIHLLSVQGFLDTFKASWSFVIVLIKLDVQLLINVKSTHPLPAWPRPRHTHTHLELNSTASISFAGGEDTHTHTQTLNTHIDIIFCFACNVTNGDSKVKWSE